MARRIRKKKMPEPFVGQIERLSHEGRGICVENERTVFVSGALPGETVEVTVHNRWKGHAEGRATRIDLASDERVMPLCEHFGVCGGCALQHWDLDKQVEHKANTLQELLTHHGGGVAQHTLAPLQANDQGYRRKARLGVRWVQAKGRVLVGFREQASNFLAVLDSCKILDPRVGERLTEIGEAIAATSIRDRIAQIEVACGDQAVALVFRVLDPPTQSDQARLVELGQRFGFHIWLQPKGPDTSHRIWPLQGPEWLSYEMPEYGLRMRFHPHDFTQVNAQINQKMMTQALGLLALKPEDRVLDLFSGLGNFTLPIGRVAAHVVGVEGSEAMTERGRMNAALHGMTQCEFHAADLTQPIADKPWAQGGFNKLLLDPARSGAAEVLEALDLSGIERIVYVSCNPATLARDVGILRARGWELTDAGIMDMFPHTAHVESMAAFVPVKK